MEEANGVLSQLLVPKDRRPEALGDLKILPDEVICAILEFLSPREVTRLACTSSVMYIFCNEEPLWMNLCLNHLRGHLQYKGSWKRTFLVMDHILKEDEVHSGRSLQFDGFNSLFLYKRMYRRYTRLNEFSVDDGRIERKKDLSLQEFHEDFDCKRPVLLLGSADTWPARTTWSVDQLLQNYGDKAFKISQRSSRKMKIKLKDYVSYMEVQHDEDPLYIFDDKFGEVAPGLLEDYNVPHLFQEDFFDVLDQDQRPPFRWLIIGPERSGASWHVDPALTSAWNTLLCGRKRWALYPPGRVPSGVTVHVNDEDGDVTIDTPSSLQWWLDIYPLLPDEDKPIECTQLPGETIFVPSGWWHCVLNLETTVAVTQNFVNSKNFEFVCLDMAPGHCHKGVCRAGLLAVEDGHLELVDDSMCHNIGHPSSRAPTKGKGMKTQNFLDDMNHDNTEFIDARCCDLWRNELPYEINFLAKFLDEDRDHYNAIWSLGSAIGQRELREWLWRLWVRKPNVRSLIWKGACLALNAEKLLGCIHKICEFHSLPFPNDDEKLPVGTGSNPVYLVSDSVIKIFVEGGLESSLYGLGTELEFYSLLRKMRSPLEKHIPIILASGIISLDNGSYTIVPWVGKYLPDAIANCSLIEDNHVDTTIPFGAWTKRLFDYRKAISMHESTGAKSSKMWPYIITRRCKGKILAELRESLSWGDAHNLASFLGEKLRNIHGIPLPYPDDSAFLNIEQKMDHSSYSKEDVVDNPTFDWLWEIFIKTLATRKKDVTDRLTKWGDPIPCSLIEKVHAYLPDDFDQLLHTFKGKQCSWIHSDIMDDNIVMEPAVHNSPDSWHADNGSISCSERSGETRSWQPAYILDFSNLSIGDPLVDLIPIYLDVFRGEPRLLKRFLESYKLPFLPKIPENKTAEDTNHRQLSYIVMCYCILHEDNVLGAVFSTWDDLRVAESWEEVEQKVWGDLNDYVGFT